MKVEVNFKVTFTIYITFVILKLTKQLLWSWWLINIPIFIIIFVFISLYIYFLIRKDSLYAKDLKINM